MKQQYFPHDCNARNDPKLQRLQMKQGMAGVGLYWCLLELLYENRGKLMQSDIEIYAFALRTDTETLTDILQNFDLFKRDKTSYWSESANSRIEETMEKSRKAKESANRRWNPPTDNGTTKKKSINDITKQLK
jgi:hypothetical protein